MHKQKNKPKQKREKLHYFASTPRWRPPLSPAKHAKLYKLASQPMTCKDFSIFRSLFLVNTKEFSNELQVSVSPLLNHNHSKTGHSSTPLSYIESEQREMLVNKF